MIQIFIHWKINPEIFKIGEWRLRYYSILFSVRILKGFEYNMPLNTGQILSIPFILTGIVFWGEDKI